MEAKTTESSPLLDFLAWLEVNKKAVAGGLIAAAVIGSAIAIYVWHKNSTEAEASEALIGLRTDLMPSRDIEPAKADAFLKIASDYPSTTAGTHAAILGAGGLFAEGKYDQAKAQFEQFISSHPDSALRPQAAFGVASSLEAMGKTDEAATRYQEIAREYRSEAVGPMANLALARIYETQGKSEQALKIYSEMEASTSPFDVWRSEAAIRREKLLAKHPELAPKAPQGAESMPAPTPAPVAPQP